MPRISGKMIKMFFFFTLKDKLLKVENNISKKNANIVLKLNRIGNGSNFEEFELPIPQDKVDQAVKIFTAINLTDNIMHSFQRRINFIYKDVEIALKYSDVWGYHLELEKIINDEKEKQMAEEKIKKVANELKIKLMTDKELTEFTKKAEENYRKSKKLY
ncbi:MAG: hypothetical protein PHI53_02660 [Candidatus Pacebacteria bacterium]|nr:hypothetical protein [Candidatus Paceibacterota bacterium]